MPPHCTLTSPAITVATTRDEVEALRAVWESMPVRNLDSDIDYFLTVIDSLPGVVGPHLVHIEREGRPPLLVVARLAEHPMPIKLGYKALLRPRLRAVVVSFDGILGAENDEDLDACITALQDSLRTADAIVFQKIALESRILRSIHRGTKASSRVRGLAVSTQWVVDLPANLDALLAQRSTNAVKRARQARRRLHRDYEEAVTIERLDRAGSSRLWDEMEKVSRTSYQRALGVGFGGENTSFSRATMALNLAAGRLRVWMLYLRGEPVAFWWGTLYGDVFAADTPSFDPRYTKDSVGTYVMHAMIEELCSDAAVRTLDFGHGDAEYKRLYASRGEEQQDVVVLARRFRPLLVGSTLSLSATLNRAAYRLLSKLRLGTKLRREWRARLARTNQSS